MPRGLVNRNSQKQKRIHVEFMFQDLTNYMADYMTM